MSVNNGECPRFKEAQKDRSLHHPSLPQPPEVGVTVSPPFSSSDDANTSSYSFVVAADTQFGMTRDNQSWEEEKEYSRQTVEYLNQMEDRPLFCCVCGDLVHMTAEIYGSQRSRQECDDIQDLQMKDFQNIWSNLHPDISLICVCGNHDVGNRPTTTSIQRFRNQFGDDYLAFWAKQSYHIVVNSNLFSDSSGAPQLFQEHYNWLEERLKYAFFNKAKHIFVFGHHPWFLYDENEDETTMTGYSPIPDDWVPSGGKVKDAYFVIPLQIRRPVLALFQQYQVTACFAGHFHQNWVSQTSFGMAMIVTGPLSLILHSTGIPNDFPEPKTRGIRVVHVADNGSFQHEFVTI